MCSLYTYYLTYRIDINFMIKVSDFGLSKRVFENKDYFRLKDSGTKLPIKWLSPESFQDGVFSEKTDVVRCLCQNNENLHLVIFKSHFQVNVIINNYQFCF